jgi:Pyruvate/2-oxoacid:ferredoxin oxidoreductase gamma subunit
MQSEVMFAGFGGQGILLSGKILAHAAMEEGYEVAWIPSYGPEMRGGTAYCTGGDQRPADRLAHHPQPQHLVAMNRPSLEKFAPRVKPGGVVSDQQFADPRQHRGPGGLRGPQPGGFRCSSRSRRPSRRSSRQKAKLIPST